MALTTMPIPPKFREAANSSSKAERSNSAWQLADGLQTNHFRLYNFKTCLAVHPLLDRLFGAEGQIDAIAIFKKHETDDGVQDIVLFNQTHSKLVQPR